MPPTEAPILRLHPDLERAVEAARADVGDATRLQAIAARLGPQLSAAPALGASWVPHVIVGALVAGGVTVAVVHGSHRAVVSPVSAPVTQSLPTAQPGPAAQPLSGQEPWIPTTTPALPPTAEPPPTPPPAQDRTASPPTARTRTAASSVSVSAMPAADSVVEEHENPGEGAPFSRLEPR